MQYTYLIKHSHWTFILTISTYFLQIYHTQSSILQPLLRPPRPEVLPIETNVKATLVHTKNLHANLYAGALGILSPQTQSNSVVTMVIQDTREDGELDLITNVGDVLSELVAVDVELCS